MRALVTFVAVSSLVACKAAPQAGPDLAPLERRIAALEKRVTTFEQAAAWDRAVSRLRAGVPSKPDKRIRRPDFAATAPTA
jgi:hypothetical protein